MLETERLCVNYGRIVGISDVSIRVQTGTIVALVGANGAGKSTFMSAVAGLLAPKSGAIRFDGEDVGALSPERRARKGMSLVPEDRGILTDLTVGENLQLARSSGRSDPARPFDEALARFPILKEFWARPAGALSGGQQQMLAIGRALVARPKLLLLDEPSLGLAPVIVDELFAAITDLRDAGSTIVLVEQFARRAIQISNYAYVMKNHCVVAEGPPAKFADEQVLNKAYLGGEADE
ncbi:MAG: ABC transporter ATP-binding protein [Rhodobacteraceae bacterium]|nr:ABC transporter ATP-binding protein [Paracoccaceae bacterium]